MTTLLPFALQDVSELPESLYQRVQQVLQTFALTHPNLGNLLVATADGFEVAAVLNEEDQERVHKVAAMTSSMLSIGTAMLTEIAAGGQQALTLEGEHNNILIYQIPTPRLLLSLTAIASAEEPLGQVLWLLRQLAANIAEVCVDKPVLNPMNADSAVLGNEQPDALEQPSEEIGRIEIDDIGLIQGNYHE